MAEKDPPITGTDPVSIDERQADSTPDTGNENIQDKSLRHQVGVRRFASHEVAQVTALLDKAERELTTLLRDRLEVLADRPPDFTTRRFRELRADIRQLRTELATKVRSQVREELITLGLMEQDFEKRIFETSVPVQLNYAVASATTIGAAIRSKPFSGGTNSSRTLQQWFDSVFKADQRRILEAVQLGLLQQETVDQIVRRVRGSAAAAFKNGAAAQVRRNAEAVVRTAINHVSNTARDEFFKANEDIVGALRWTSTLDGRTSFICGGRDGKFAPVVSGATLPSSVLAEDRLEPPSARPPAHPNCRSVMVAILDPEKVEEVMPARPFVTDTRTGRKRQVDFRAETRDKIGQSKWKAMTPKQRNSAVKSTRQSWSRENIGLVPGEVDYDTWLRRQSTGFQNEVLGPTRGKAFRDGLKMDQFTDRRGNELTLDQLSATESEFF